MAKRKTRNRPNRIKRHKSLRGRNKSRHGRVKKPKSGFLIRKHRRPAISDAKLERGLRVLNETDDPKAAAHAIRVSPEKFKRAAKRKNAIRKRKGRWMVAARLPRRIAIFTDGKQLAITVRSKTASLIGRYNSAVGQFLRTNNPDVLAEFAGRVVKDIHGKSYPLTTEPNVLYRLSSTGAESFTEIYRLVLQ